jgi:hypothetical protein
MSDEEFISHDIPIMYMYFSLVCPLSSQDAKVLENDKYQTNGEWHPTIFQELLRGQGCLAREPVISLQIGFQLYEYDFDLFDIWTERLFAEIEANKTLILKRKESKSISARLTVNMNSMNCYQRPVFYLSPEQLSVLAEFGATFRFDGYVLFSRTDDDSDQDE